MSSFHIALNFEDGVTRFVTSRPGETIADAAYRERVNIPVDCRDGACGTCKSVCESGTYDSGPYLEEALTEEEAAEGFCLPCQMRASSDCVLRIAASSAACKVKAVSLPGTVCAVDQLSPSTIAVSLRFEDSSGPSFLSGQYAHLGVPGTGMHRAYSFCSAPGANVAEFLIRNIPGGRMSSYLTMAAKTGDQLAVEGPYGSFYLRPVQRPVLMLAGGTGLAPFLSMLRQLEGGHLEHPVHLVYGVTNEADLVKRDTLDAMTESLSRFTYATCVASPSSDHPRRGFVTEHLPDELLLGGDVDVYLCGPPAMVEAVRSSFRDRGFTPANFYYEKFAPSEEARP